MTAGDPWTFLAALAFPGGRPRVDDPLRSAARRRLLSLIRSEPGITMLQLADRGKVPWGSIHYHLKRLEQAGLIRVDESLHDMRARRLYAADALLPPMPAIRHPALEGAAYRTAELIVQYPGMGLEELVEVSGRSRRTIQTHLKGLVEAGLVVSASHTRYQRLEPTPTLHDLMRLRAVEESTNDAK